MDPEFARGLRRLCDARDAALILDDVRCGFRLSLAGSWAPLATSTFRRPVPERATVTHTVVASVPFLAKMAQSACSTVSTSNSASSTMRSDGPFWQSASACWRAAAASTAGWRCPSTIGP